MNLHYAKWLIYNSTYDAMKEQKQEDRKKKKIVLDPKGSKFQRGNELLHFREIKRGMCDEHSRSKRKDIEIVKLTDILRSCEFPRNNEDSGGK